MCKTCKSSDTILEKENRLYFIICEACGSSESSKSRSAVPCLIRFCRTFRLRDQDRFPGPDRQEKGTSNVESSKRRLMRLVYFYLCVLSLYCILRDHTTWGFQTRLPREKVRIAVRMTDLTKVVVRVSFRGRHLRRRFRCILPDFRGVLADR